jgi:predicted esterase
MGVGGQMALYLGFNARDLVRGVATTGAVATGQLKNNDPLKRLAFYLLVGDRDPLAPAVKDSRTKLVERRFPVVLREIPNLGRQYPEEQAVLREVARWIDSLDRQ